MLRDRVAGKWTRRALAIVFSVAVVALVTGAVYALRPVAPVVSLGVLYVLANQGLLDAYDLQSGTDVYRQRIPHEGSGFSASPVAANGRIYLSSEDGDIFVVRAGPSFELLGRYPMGEPLMATPAIAGNHLYVRGAQHLFAIGER